MKSSLLKLGLILCFILLFVNPTNTIASGSRALTLWAQNIVPALFPAVIISSLLVEMDAAAMTARLLYPITRTFLGISQEGTYCLLTGILCGFPMGSKTISQMLQRNSSMSILQARSLFAICSFPSPMFLIGFVYTKLLQECIPLPIFLLCIYLPIFPIKALADFVYLRKEDRNQSVFRIFRHRQGPWKVILRNSHFLSKHCRMNRSRILCLETVDQIVMDSALLMLRIGGYMVLFSILAGWFLLYLHQLPTLALMLCGSCEMTIGLNAIVSYCAMTGDSLQKVLPILCFFLTFGGLSTVAQTSCVIRNTALSLSHYIIFRMCYGLCSGFLMWLYLFL